MLRKFTLALLSLLLVPLAMMAQDVSISAKKGDLIAGVGGANTSDSGKSAGFFSTWKHKQLALTVNGSDMGFLTQAGDLFDPSCVITTLNGEDLVVANGQTQTFLVVSLPKGYSITGYTAVLQPNLYGDYFPSSASSWNSKNIATWFYETKAWASESPFTDDTKDTYTTGSTPLSENDARFLAVAKAGTDIEMNPSADASKEFIITRTANDMGNRLYFWVPMSGSYYSFTIKSFVIYFTAQGTFEAEVEPKTSIGSATNYVTSPFTTSKTDFGAVSYNSNYRRYMYDYSNVKDVIAYNHLYQEDAAATGKPVVGDGDIRPVEIGSEGHYAFGSNTYYVEPPTTGLTPSGQTFPIGFRVVGATFKWLGGKATKGGTQTIGNSCYVRRGTNGSNYLNAYLFFNSSGGVQWQFDEYGNLYTGSGEYKQYLACYGEGFTRMLSLSATPTGSMAQWNLKRDGNGHLYYLSDGGNYYYLYTKQITEGGATHYRGYLVKSNGTYGTAVLDDGTTVSATSSYNGGLGYTEVTTTNPSGGSSQQLPSFTPGGYKLTIYDKDGKTVLGDVIEVSAAEATVPATSANGTVVLGQKSFTGFNNDAVKFKVEVDEGCQALIDITLKLEALNPYIDQMTVVCTDPETNTSEDEANPVPLRMTQTFTASDFGVNGGAFHFNLPAACAGHDVKITFEDLYSHYGDETYGGSGNARYSFVTSPYFSAFDGKDNNAVTPTEAVTWNDDATDGGIYDTRYVGSGSNVQPGASIPSEHKIYTGVAGDKAFKFNNAEVLTGGGSLTEYEFSVSTYTSTATGGTGGTFKEIVLNTGSEDSEAEPSGTFYLFTADETRYNIAPTKSWQHRFYAFYTMDVSVEATYYEPKVEFVPVYAEGETCYVDEEGNEKYDAFYGAVVTAPYEDGGVTKPGYASTDIIFEKINEKILAGEDDFGHTAVPADSKHLLYLDFSQLAGIFQITTSEQTSMDDYSSTNSPNCLIFLPVGASAPNNNVASKTKAGTFHAAHNIVLTDKQPFYSPYDIQVDAAQFATYTREITVDANDKVANATVMLPFQMSVTSGKHTNEANVPGARGAFTVNEMKAGQSMKTQEGSTINYGTAYFAPITASKTTANRPYMIHVDTDVTDGTISFIATEKGAGITATPAATANAGSTGVFFTGETPQANVTLTDNTSNDYYFANKGTYSGGVFDRAVSEDVFYFANDKYLNLHTLSAKKQYFYLYPFRAAYVYSTTAPTAKQMRGFFIDFGDEFGDNPTGINKVTAEADLMIRAGKGVLYLAASRDQNVAIHTINGMNVSRIVMNAGEPQVVSLPAGIYIVNGTKIVVK